MLACSAKPATRTGGEICRNTGNAAWDTMKTNYTNLDFLRSLAVLAVVAQHLWHQCVNFQFCAYDPSINQFLGNLSFTGVMFFFVHTCLVLMLSMHRAPAEHFARSFLIRRAFRIYPLCWVTILLALTTGLTDNPEATLHLMGWQGVAANLVLIQNIMRSFPSVVGPLWSLPWEVQMYLVLPLFFAGLQRFNGLIPVFVVWLGSAILAIAATQPPLPRMFHAAVFPPMFIGGMVAYKLLERRTAEPHRRLFPAWTWPLFVLVLFILKDRLTGPYDFESPAGAGVNAGICLLLAVAIPAFSEFSAAWIVFPVKQIAKYPYGIYLLHVPTLIFVMRYLPRMPLALTVLAFLSLTALLSFAVFHAIENPHIQMGRRLTQASAAPRTLDTVSTPQPAGVLWQHFPPTTSASPEHASNERSQHAAGLDHYPGL
jgi:peptidoglycan/LPS O-acetylase OafA/YrhL